MRCLSGYRSCRTSEEFCLYSYERGEGFCEEEDGVFAIFESKCEGCVLDALDEGISMMLQCLRSQALTISAVVMLRDVL